MLPLAVYYLGFTEGVWAFCHDKRVKIQVSAVLKLKEKKFLMTDID